MDLFALLEKQGISPRIISSFRRVPRERFVASAQPYADDAQPIGHGQTISQPSLVALTLDELELSGAERVLEIGAGSGYVVALLSLLCREVVGVERVPELVVRAQKVLSSLEKEKIIKKNYSIVTAGVNLGVPGEKFDRILVSAAAASMPAELLAQLNEGGVMIIPVGKEEQWLWKVTKEESGVREEKLLAVRFVRLH